MYSNEYMQAYEARKAEYLSKAIATIKSSKAPLSEVPEIYGEACWCKPTVRELRGL